MNYDFDTLVKRSPDESVKWDVYEDELPMWVADMDFPTAPEILQAVSERAQRGCFGYVKPSKEWKNAIISWWKERYDFVINDHWLLYCIGVMPAISSTIRCLTNLGDRIALFTPVYNHFFDVILNNDRKIAECELDYKNGTYTIDWDYLEVCLKRPEVTAFLLSNPHNPTGQIWSRETLLKLGKLCRDNNVLVLSDEIHCDLTEPGITYVPFASISEEDRLNSVSFIAPTKTFNLAGLKTSAIVAAYEKQRHIIRQSLFVDELWDANTFSSIATIAAYTKGGPWLDSLRIYISDNKKYVHKFLELEIPDIIAIKSEATYLIWLDVSRVTDNSTEFSEFLRNNAKIYLAEGSKYHGNGRYFLRINIACPRFILEDGLNRLKEGTEHYRKEHK